MHFLRHTRRFAAFAAVAAASTAVAYQWRTARPAYASEERAAPALVASASPPLIAHSDTGALLIRKAITAKSQPNHDQSQFHQKPFIIGVTGQCTACLPACLLRTLRMRTHSDQHTPHKRTHSNHATLYFIAKHAARCRRVKRA